MEQSGTSALLQGAVQDLSSDVVCALRGGDHVGLPGSGSPDGPEGGLALAAVRVLGADLLLPHVLSRNPPAPGDPRSVPADRDGLPAPRRRAAHRHVEPPRP